MSTTNVDTLDRALADGKLTEEQYSEALAGAVAADEENTAREAAAASQQALREMGTISRALPPQTEKNPNAEVVKIMTADALRAMLADDDKRTFLVAVVDDITMRRGQSGTVSGFCQIAVNGKAGFGALTIYAPKAEEVAASTLRPPKHIDRDRKSGTDLLAEMDRLFPIRGLAGDELVAAMVKRAPMQVQADEYFARAADAEAKYLADVAAAKGSWLGKTALDVLHWRETAGATAGPNLPPAEVHGVTRKA